MLTFLLLLLAGVFSTVAGLSGYHAFEGVRDSYRETGSLLKPGPYDDALPLAGLALVAGTFAYAQIAAAWLIN